MGSWHVFCYEAIPSYSVGEQDLINPNNQTLANGTALCLEQAFFPSAAHGILAVCSAAFAGLKHTSVKRIKPSWVLTTRIVLSLLLFVNALSVFCTSFWLARDRSYAQLLFQVVELLSWLVHIMCLGAISLSAVHSGFGPLLLHFAWLLTLVTATFQFKNVIEFATGEGYTEPPDMYYNSYFSVLMQVTVYVRFGLQCLYLATLPFPVRSPWQSNSLHRKGRLAINTTTENQPLLNSCKSSGPVISSHAIRGYGSLQRQHPQRYSLEASEDEASLLSRLTFWWLEPLMRKGSLGLLQRPDDLPQLPHSLQTAVLRERFQQLLRKHTHQPLVDTVEEDVKILNHSETASRAFSPNSGLASEYRPVEGQNSVDDSPADGCSGIDMRSGSSTSQATLTRPSLFYILNRAFGLHYYPLGVLKLASDCLGFAGPLLLNALVKFMEEQTVRCSRQEQSKS